MFFLFRRSRPTLFLSFFNFCFSSFLSYDHLPFLSSHFDSLKSTMPTRKSIKFAVQFVLVLLLIVNSKVSPLPSDLLESESSVTTGSELSNESDSRSGGTTTLVTTRRKSLVESRSIALNADAMFELPDRNSNDHDEEAGESSFDFDLDNDESQTLWQSVPVSNAVPAEPSKAIRNMMQRESRSDFMMNGCHCRVKEQMVTRRFFRSGRQKKFKLSCKCNEEERPNVMMPIPNGNLNTNDIVSTAESSGSARSNVKSSMSMQMNQQIQNKPYSGSDSLASSSTESAGKSNSSDGCRCDDTGCRGDDCGHLNGCICNQRGDCWGARCTPAPIEIRAPLVSTSSNSLMPSTSIPFGMTSNRMAALRMPPTNSQNHHHHHQQHHNPEHSVPHYPNYRLVTRNIYLYSVPEIHAPTT